MMLVAPDAVEPERLRVLELIEVCVVDVVPFLGVVQRVGNVDPHAPMFLSEVVGEVRPGHQVEPGELHGLGASGVESSAFESQPAPSSHAEVQAIDPQGLQSSASTPFAPPERLLMLPKRVVWAAVIDI